MSEINPIKLGCEYRVVTPKHDTIFDGAIFPEAHQNHVLNAGNYSPPCCLDDHCGTVHGRCSCGERISVSTQYLQEIKTKNKEEIKKIIFDKYRGMMSILGGGSTPLGMYLPGHWFNALEEEVLSAINLIESKPSIDVDPEYIDLIRHNYPSLKDYKDWSLTGRDKGIVQIIEGSTKDMLYKKETIDKLYSLLVEDIEKYCRERIPFQTDTLDQINRIMMDAVKQDIINIINKRWGKKIMFSKEHCENCQYFEKWERIGSEGNPLCHPKEGSISCVEHYKTKEQVRGK